MDASRSVIFEKSPFLAKAEINDKLVRKSIDALIEFISPQYFKMLSEPYIDENLFVPNAAFPAGEKRFAVKLNCLVMNVQDSPVSELLRVLLEKVKNLGFSPNGILVTLEKGFSECFAKEWHTDAADSSTIICWSSHKRWSTYFQDSDFVNGTPASHGCFYNAAEYKHRSPHLEDFQEDLKDGLLPNDSYRLLVQLYDLSL